MSNERMNQYKNIAVFGQGYVGLPLSLSFAFRGCNVYGVDVVEAMVRDINNGITYHTEEFEGKSIREILKAQLQNGNYRAIIPERSIFDVCSTMIVTVGIPIRDGVHDLSDLNACVTNIGENLKKGDLIIIRSTVIPGTTEEVVVPLLEKFSGLVAGVDFYLAYSSERIAEGNAFNEFAFMPTVVGGINEESAKLAKEVLEIVCKVDVIIASNIKIVETAKVFENVQRDVNIAMVQEFARFTEALGIDIHEVVEVANTHKRVKLLTPGPGVGGYCIPNAYHYLSPKAEELNVSMDLLKLSRMKNSELPKVMADMLEAELNKKGKQIQNARIGVLGIAMKDYSNDDRISPPIQIIEALSEREAEVFAFDPAVPTEYAFKVDQLNEALSGMDAVMVLAKQKAFDEIGLESLLELLEPDSVVFDTRNLFKKFSAELIKNNIIYRAV